ncbi:peptidase M16 family protein [Heterostelium album PN500]|uniref:Peptidase M16 family protein n=1 Tax=Heterostelium pallidum (strain ATCC 26659 / Pp 5 / PN500) TaxID=670386 RepID=D3B7E4_HETP5|nr:peptidase M16 family protein [Heterostelium album PN500]EFA82687.1 peptidase M16 family protein [Heterostelium album PN500]|eukprot:XP_020434804.1 peptidase M16 family protein [Heterostelium album PN500]
MEEQRQYIRRISNHSYIIIQDTLINDYLQEIDIKRQLYQPVYSSSSFQETKRVAELSTLSNGLKVVSLSGGFTGPAVSLGLFVNTGSRFETQQTAGVNQLLKNMVFQSNASKIHLEVQREIEVMGSTAFAQASRDNLLISTQTLPTSSLQMLSIIGELTNPTLPYHEVRDTASFTNEESESLSHCSETSLFEDLHRAAYRGRTLGRPLVAPSCNLGNLSHEQVQSYANQIYSPSNMVLVGVGLAHKELVSEAEHITFGRQTSTGSSAANVQIPRSQAKYVGGDSLTYQTGSTSVALAFEGFAASASTKDLVASAVLQAILGSGSVQPLTAPGAGKTSRLFNLLEKSNGAVESAECFSFNYADSGLFGIYASAADATTDAATIVKQLVAELVAASRTSGQELERAKQLTKKHYFELCEQRSSALEFVGKQALYNTKVLTPEEFAAAVSQVTAEDVKRVASKILASRPTLAVRGNLDNVPTQDEISITLV